jgi:hypothetical protein
VRSGKIATSPAAKIHKTAIIGMDSKRPLSLSFINKSLLLFDAKQQQS